MKTDILAGKYRLVREIARSNDIVYEAVDTVMGRRVAVKELLIPPNLTGALRRERIERFNREARAAGKLSHPNVVTVYDFGEDGGRYFIAMEYLEGVTLRDRLQAQGALPIHDAVHIARQVLDGLAHAHRNKVVHRDVKPENIHILPQGLVKLTDFGIARLTEEASLTGEGQVFGTPSYMSPEQIMGGSIDHRSDLFSLAVVLYEMLTGRKPFTGDSVITITYAIMNAEPPFLTGVPPALASVVMKGLAKDPGQRYQSAEAMSQALLEAMTARSADVSPNWHAANVPQPLPPQPASFPPAPSMMSGSPVCSSPQYLPSGPPPPVTVIAPQLQSPGAPQPTAGAMHPPQAVQGPFATWGPAPAVPTADGSGAVPPPIPMRPQGLSPAMRTFFGVLGISVVLAGIILGAVILFVRSYEEHRRSSRVLALRQMLLTAHEKAESGDIEGAVQLYNDVLRVSAQSPEGLSARTSLGELYNRLGVDAARQGRHADALRWFQSVVALYERFPNDMSRQDMETLDLARENYAAVVSRVSERGELAPQPRGMGELDAGVVTPDPGQAVLEARAKVAQDLLNQGEQAYRDGHVALARELWQQAAQAAPGTAPSRRAQEWLMQTAPTPFFGSGMP